MPIQFPALHGGPAKGIDRFQIEKMGFLGHARIFFSIYDKIIMLV
jgi:hypothetical protein